VKLYKPSHSARNNLKALHSAIGSVEELQAILAPQFISIGTHFIVGNNILVRSVSYNGAQHCTDFVIINGESSHGSFAVDLLMIPWIGADPSPPRHICSQIRQHLIQCCGVNGGIHPAGTVRSHLPESVFKTRDQCIITIITAGDIVHPLIVLQPESNIPGLPVCPTIVVGALRNHGGESIHGLNCGAGSFVPLECIVRHRRAPLRVPLCHFLNWHSINNDALIR
jgi:hypothetical protein